jgi:predicted nucleic acid-binding protein
MRILFDTNIILDVLLNRDPFVADSQQLWQAADAGILEACIASFTIPTIHYICRKHAGKPAADAAVDYCLDAFEVCALYRESLFAARKLPGNDFEDNLQLACAMNDFVQGIVTRNPDDFPGSPLPLYSPQSLLAAIHR